MELESSDKKRTEADSKKGSKEFRLIGVGLIVIALLIAAYTFYSTRGSIKTMGQVTRVDSYSKGSQTTYIPTFSFTDEQGSRYMASISYSVDEFNYVTGEMVEIYYDPENFSSVDIASFTALWGLPLFFSGLGLFIIWLSFKMEK